MAPNISKQPISGCFFSFSKEFKPDFERNKHNSYEIEMVKALSIVYI